MLLSYKEGGKILTSMGHWIELMRINTTEEKFFAAAENLYGKSYAEKVKSDYSSLAAPSSKAQYLLSASVSFIQNQSPGTNNALLNSKNGSG